MGKTSPVELSHVDHFWGMSAVVFDMDGVVTDTALSHATAWEETFNDYLATRAAMLDELGRWLPGLISRPAHQVGL